MEYTLLDDREIAKNPYTRIVISKTCSHHYHTFFEFTLCAKGRYRNCINDKWLDVTKGRLLLLRPQDRHYFAADGTHIFRDIYVSVEVMKAICNSINPTLYSEIESKSLLVDFQLSDLQLQLLENKLNFLNEPTNKSALSLDIRHRNIVMDIFDLWQQNAQTKQTNLPTWLSSLLTQIGTSENLNKTVDELIEDTHYSHGYICREFKKHIGQTLQNYLNDARFSYALSILAGDGTIAEIAEKLGYSDTSNFIVAFKKHFGLTPAQWRKNKI